MTPSPDISEIAYAIGAALAVEDDVNTFNFLISFTPTRVEQNHKDAISVKGRGLIPSVDTYHRAEKAVGAVLGRKLYFNCTGEPFFSARIQ